MITLKFKPEKNIAQGAVTIDGVVYIMVFKYDGRNDRWILDIRSQDDEPLALGIKLVERIDLLEGFSDSRLPTGQLFATRTKGAPQPVTKGDLGNSVLVNYMSKTELDFLALLSLGLNPPRITVQAA